MLKNEHLRKIVLIVAKKLICSFRDLLLESGMSPSTLQYRLAKLVKGNILRKSSRGYYTLAYRTPLAFLSDRAPIAYVGLLGLKEGHEEPEWLVASNLLKREGFLLKKIVVIASPKTISSWNNNFMSNVDWKLFKSDELFDPSSCSKVLEPIIAELIKEYALIADITAGPRPAGIVLHKIASRYYVPQIYVREDTKKLYWIVSLEEILRNMGIMS